MELLGNIPAKLAYSGHKYNIYFSKDGYIKRIDSIKYWCLLDILIEKYVNKYES